MSQTPLASLTERFHDFRCRDANARVFLGLNRDLGELPDPSLAAGRSDEVQARALLTDLQALDQSELSFDSRLDCELMALMLEQEAFHARLRFNGRVTREQLPQAASGLMDGIFGLFVGDPRPADERLLDISARLEAAPDFLQAMRDRLDTPVERWLQIELDKLTGLPALLENIRDWAERQRWSGRDRLERACAQALAAVQGYAAELRLLPTTRQFHLEEADARELVRLGGIELSLEQLHGLASEFLARSGEQIEALRSRLCAKYGLADDVTAAELQIFLQRRHAVAQDQPLTAILDRYRQEAEKIEAFIRERALFPLPENQALKIIQTPDFLAPNIPAGAMEPPAPFREGIRTSLIYLTLSEELRDEHTALGIPSMMIHEGIPGHHLQLAMAAMHPSVVRRHVSANEHAEGWTTMLEDYMLDQGYMGELTDEARFVTKLDLSRIGARVAIDLFFMTGQRAFLDVGVDCDLSDPDPFVAAGTLLQRVTGFVPGRVQAELNWYSIERGYPLSYLTGNQLVWDLKREVERHCPELDARERDRLFHRSYLEAGNMPLSFLRRVFVHNNLVAP